MKNYLKLSLLVTLLTGAVEMRAPEGETQVVQGRVVEGARPGEAREGVVMAIDGQATAAAKVADHNTAMIKTMNSVIPGGVKIAAPMGGGISFGDDAAEKPAAASAPVSGKGGISLVLGKPSINSDGSSVKINPNNSTEETHTADDGSKVVVHRDADGTIQKAVITHKVPKYSLRSVTDSLGFTNPKTTTINYFHKDGTHEVTTEDESGSLYTKSDSKSVTLKNGIPTRTSISKTTVFPFVSKNTTTTHDESGKPVTETLKTSANKSVSATSTMKMMLTNRPAVKTVDTTVTSKINEDGTRTPVHEQTTVTSKDETDPDNIVHTVVRTTKNSQGDIATEDLDPTTKEVLKTSIVDAKGNAIWL